MPPGNSSRRAGYRSIAAVLACLGVLASAAAAQSPRLSAPVEQDAAFVPGEVIVRFEPGTSRGERREVRKDADVAFSDSLGAPRAELVDVEGSVKGAIRRLKRQPGVAYAQPNYRYEALAVSADTFSEDLWGLSDPAMPEPGVYVEGAWDDTRGAGQVIAVLDTGVDLTHLDLKENLWDDPDEPGLDDHGHDFVDGDSNPDDYQFHGTHVAGTAAAIADNSLGVAGVAPEAEIMAVRVLDGDGSGESSEIAGGIEYAAQQGADVINMSLGGVGGGAGDLLMSDAIDVAGAADAVVVAAAGNEAADNDAESHTPCALSNPNLICVAAVNQSGGLASFSNWGAKSVDIAAPGTSILSTKADYGPPIFEDEFETTPTPWVTQVSSGGKPWGLSSIAAKGLSSATDSPGENYAPSPAEGVFARSSLYSEDPVDLSGERGCRLHFQTRYQIAPVFDMFFAGSSLTGSLSSIVGPELDGTSPGFSEGRFIREEISIANRDGRSDVHPAFRVRSDFSIQLDGAYVDDVRVVCRDETYVDAVPVTEDYDLAESGFNYVEFRGTSMATPHVSGIVALARAAVEDEGGELNALEAVDAVLDGASAIPEVTSGKRTATEGIADACKAIAVATGGDVATECPASSDPTPQPPPVGGGGGGGGGTVVTPTSEEPSEPGQPRSTKRSPQTFFKQHPPKVVLTNEDRVLAVFRFGANAEGATFLCSVDGRPFRRCPARFARRYRIGRHVVKVKARNAAGAVDRTAAVFRFTVKHPG
jgi:thermitase